MTKTRGTKHIEPSPAHWLEWLVGSVCTILVVALFAVIAHDIYRYEAQDAQFEISILSIEPAKEGYRVTFDIHNTSLTTAAGVHVTGNTYSSSGMESAAVTFDYVGSESHEIGTLFFRARPTPEALDVRVAGYTNP